MNNEHTVDNKYIDAKVLGFSTVAAILGATFAIAMSTSAATPEALGVAGGWRGGCESEQHEEVETAIENGDYHAWKALMNERGGWRGHVTDVVTAENFATFAALHAAMEVGDSAKVAELRTELGLGIQPEDTLRSNGRRGGGFRGMGMHTNANQ
jgi:hypothetical protein